MSSFLPNQKPITIQTTTSPFFSHTNPHTNTHKPLPLSRTSYDNTSKTTTTSLYEPTQCSLSLSRQNNTSASTTSKPVNTNVKPKSISTSTSPLRFRPSDHELQLHLIKKENVTNLTKLHKLQNRIAILQKQNLLNEKKLHQLQLHQHHKQQIISSKLKLKKQLEECKSKQQQSFQLQHKKIQNERIINKEHLTNVITQRKAKAKKINQHMKNDKLAIQTKLKESYLHTYNENVKKCNLTKKHRLVTNIKREQDKIDKSKQHQQQVLNVLEREIQNNNIINKNIKELEMLEEQCLQKYKHTLSLRKQKEGKSCLNTSMIHMHRGQKYKLDDKINEEDDNDNDGDDEGSVSKVNGYVRFSNNSVNNRKNKKIICLNYTEGNNVSKDCVGVGSRRSGNYKCNDYMMKWGNNAKQIRIVKGCGIRGGDNNNYSDGKCKRKKVKHVSFDKNMYNEYMGDN